MGFYQIVNELDKNRLNMVAIVVDGDHSGHKAVFEGEKLKWESDSHGFFADHVDIINTTEKAGIVEADGERVFYEVLGTDKKLVICGGGHISMSLIKLGRMLGFFVTVLEDRPVFAGNAKAAGANKVICDDYKKGLETISGDENTYFIIVTRGHNHDRECLEAIIKKPNAYIGMIGSRSKVKMVMEYLKEGGVDKEKREAVHTPIGLNIGAETPEEIAISIMAEIIEVKNRGQKNGGYEKKLLKALLEASVEKTKKYVLATIISRRGSAPREIGTKMLIEKNGACIGTIGGGCLEAEVMNRARQMLVQEKPYSQICEIDMTNSDAESEGMICGGIEEVFLEIV